MNQVIRFFVVCVLVSGVVGCGQRGPDTHPVTGKVTIAGVPASGVQITFHAIDPAQQSASGTVASDGTYTLLTGVSGTAGAMVGTYKVTLSESDVDAGDTYESAGKRYENPELDASSDSPDPDENAGSGKVPEE